MKTTLLSLSLLAGLLFLTGCAKNQNGVCEMKWGTSNYKYYCQPEEQEYCSAGWERYFESESCSDLGYTEKYDGEGGPIDGPVFVSPDGPSEPGENGYWATGTGGTGSQGGGGSGNCDLENYNGPEFDIQVDAQCKAAYMYDCIGDYTARDASCDLYYQYGNDVWIGPGSLPECPYCN